MTWKLQKHDMWIIADAYQLCTMHDAGQGMFWHSQVGFISLPQFSGCLPFVHINHNSHITYEQPTFRPITISEDKTKYRYPTFSTMIPGRQCYWFSYFASQCRKTLLQLPMNFISLMKPVPAIVLCHQFDQFEECKGGLHAQNGDSLVSGFKPSLPGLVDHAFTPGSFAYF